MKLKILIVPIVIVFSIVLVIWVLIPEYQTASVEAANLKAASEKVKTIQEKNQMIEKLSNDLKNDADAQATIARFVPAQKQEEETIDNINFIASGEGLAVSNISVLPENKNQVALQPLLDENGIEIPPSAILPEPSEFMVNAVVMGDYEKIRSFIGKMAGLKRYNDIDTLKIAPIPSTGGGATEKIAVTGALVADITFAFEYFSKDKSVVTVDNSIFTDGKFDIAAVNDINQKMQTAIMNLTIGSAGKQNPFLP
jgi:Tfp pilus assembly protein PilO